MEDKEVQTAVGSPVSLIDKNEDSPTPYAGKFDPKAIAKKAVGSSSATSTLGKDLPISEVIKASTSLPSTRNLQSEKNPKIFESASQGLSILKHRFLFLITFNSFCVT